MANPLIPFCLWTVVAGVLGLSLGLRAHAQGFGTQPPDGQPANQSPFGQAPFGQVPYGPQPGGVAPFAFGQQPGGPPQQGPPQQGMDGPSLVGTWSGQSMSQNGPLQESDYFGPDGSYVSVGRLQNGFVARAWGRYRVTPINQGQLRVDTQLQGWLPQQLCRQEYGAPPSCIPFQIPQTDSATVSFLSSTSFVSVTQSSPGMSVTLSRDANPYLLQMPVQQQFVLQVPAAQPAYPSPSYQPTPSAPVVMPYQPISPRNAGPKCDDLQQRRICNINDGHLVSSGGCLVCVSP